MRTAAKLKYSPHFRRHSVYQKKMKINPNRTKPPLGNVTEKKPQYKMSKRQRAKIFLRISNFWDFSKVVKQSLLLLSVDTQLKCLIVFDLQSYEKDQVTDFNHKANFFEKNFDPGKKYQTVGMGSGRGRRSNRLQEDRTKNDRKLGENLVKDHFWHNSMLDCYSGFKSSFIVVHKSGQAAKTAGTIKSNRWLVA